MLSVLRSCPRAPRPQLTQLKKTMRFKALDSVVQTYHKGEKQSLTQRCAEVSASASLPKRHARPAFIHTLLG